MSSYTGSKKIRLVNHLKKFKRIWHLLRSNTFAFVGALVVGAIVVIAIFAPVIAPYSPTEQTLTNTLAPPSSTHWLGTDDVGRDIFSRIIYGTRYALAIGLLVVALEVTAGVSIGIVSGYYRGNTDEFLMRLIDVLISIPPLLLAMVIVTTFGVNIWNAIIAVSVVFIPMMARTVRSAALSEREETYIQAARGLGYSDRRIMLKHMLRNIISPIVVLSTSDVAYALISVATLSFIGLGVQPPTPSWGAMANQGRTYIFNAPELIIFPTLAIAIAALGFNLLGIGLREIIIYGDTESEMYR